MEKAIINTPLGYTKIEGDIDGIQSITVSDETLELTKNIPKELKTCIHQLEEYFEGELKEFSFKMNPIGTDFQKSVWDLLLQIPYGKTVSYLDLSKTYGDVKAIRAVASANGKNPLWIAVPCHRTNPQ